MPGRVGRAEQVLAQVAEEPPERHGSSGRARGMLLLMAVLVVAAASVGVGRGVPPEPAPEPVPPLRSSAVQATSLLLAQDPLRVRLLVEVRMGAEPGTTGLPGSGAPAAQVRLQGFSAPGLVVRVVDRPLPVPLGYVGRFGSGLEQVVRLTVDVVALGCAEPERPRRLAMTVTRSSPDADLDATLPVRDSAEVTQALEALVRRSCRDAGR